MANTTWTDWSALETKVPTGEKQAFERAFMQLAAPADVEDTPYKTQAAESVQAVLEQLEDEGRVKQEGNKLFVDKSLIPEAFQKYIGDEEDG